MMKHVRLLSLWLVMGTVWLSACQKQDDAAENAETAPAVEPRTGPPALDELQSTTFHGLEGLEPVTLQDGMWQGAPAVAGGASRPEVRLLDKILLQGDLDADGFEESVAFLDLATGGSGQLLHLSVVKRVDGSPRNVATALIGDRVQIRAARIEAKAIVLDVVQAGPDDAMCCPGELATRTWTLQASGGLQPGEAIGATGRLSLETIAATDWVLRFWEWQVAAPLEPQVTLRFDEGRFVGTNGCNNYFASAAAGEAPGDLTVGLGAATRRACPGTASVVESRFMQQLGGVKKFGFMLGYMALTYTVEGRTGVMLFAEASAEPPASPETEAP